MCPKSRSRPTLPPATSGARRSPDGTTIPAVSFIPTEHLLPFALVTGLFFLWGMSNNLTDILVQQFKKSFELSPVQAQLVQTAVFLGYFTMAVPSALVMRRFGYRTGILLGLCIFGVGTLLFWPAASIGRYAPFLLALFIVGCGSAILETAANPFIAQFGPPETAERRLNFAQAFNPPGTIAGVLIGTFFIFSGVEHSASRIAEMKAAGSYATYLHSELLRVVPTYQILGASVLLMAAIIAGINFPPLQTEHEDSGSRGHFPDLFRYPQLWLAVGAQFFYVGTQVSIWSACIFYMRQYTGVGERTAALFLTGHLIALAIGRMVSTWLMHWFRPSRMLGAYAAMSIALLLFGILRPSMSGALAILTTSFFMSIMYPTIFAMGVRGLGFNTKLGGSLIVMALVGGAFMPPMLGYIARQTGSYALGHLVPLAGFVAIAIYAILGSRIGSEASE